VDASDPRGEYTKFPLLLSRYCSAAGGVIQMGRTCIVLLDDGKHSKALFNLAWIQPVSSNRNGVHDLGIDR
jgi:hypothetical protein